MPSFPSRGAARASSRTRNPRPSNQRNARISANRASSRGHSWPSTGPASRRWTGDGRTQPRRTCRKTPLRCRLSRPPLQSSASLSHRFPTTPRRKHSRTRRLQRRLMRRAGCRVPAQFPPYHFSSTQKALLRQSSSNIFPVSYLISTLLFLRILSTFLHTHQSNTSPHPSLPPLHLLPLPPHPHLFHFSQLLPPNLPPTPLSSARARACSPHRTCNGFEHYACGDQDQEYLAHPPGASAEGTGSHQQPAKNAVRAAKRFG